MHLRKPKIKVKKKFVVIIGSLNFTDEMKRLSMILEHKGFVVLYPKPTPFRNKFRDICQKFLTAIESCDLVILYNHLGYIGSGTLSELTYAFKYHKPVYSINPKYFGFYISNKEIDMDSMCSNKTKPKLPKFYEFTKEDFYKRKILILTNQIKKKYYESFWKNAKIDSLLMIEDINRAFSGSINKPEKVDVIVIDNIETEGFITKLAYEYIRSLYVKTEIYLTEQPGWDIKSLSNDTLSVTRLINSIKIDKGQTIREFGNAKFLKIGRRKSNVIITRSTTKR